VDDAVRIDESERPRHDLRLWLWREGLFLGGSVGINVGRGRRDRPPSRAWPHYRDGALRTAATANRSRPLQPTQLAAAKGLSQPRRGALYGRGNLMEKAWPARHLEVVESPSVTDWRRKLGDGPRASSGAPRPAGGLRRRFVLAATGARSGPGPAAGAFWAQLRGCFHPQVPRFGEVISRDGRSLAGCAECRGVSPTGLIEARR